MPQRTAYAVSVNGSHPLENYVSEHTYTDPPPHCGARGLRTRSHEPMLGDSPITRLLAPTLEALISREPADHTRDSSPRDSSRQCWRPSHDEIPRAYARGLTHHETPRANAGGPHLMRSHSWEPSHHETPCANAGGPHITRSLAPMPGLSYHETPCANAGGPHTMRMSAHSRLALQQPVRRED